MPKCAGTMRSCSVTATTTGAPNAARAAALSERSLGSAASKRLHDAALCKLPKLRNPVAAVVLAIHVGFTAVVVVALMLYGVAAAARP